MPKSIWSRFVRRNYGKIPISKRVCKPDNCRAFCVLRRFRHLAARTIAGSRPDSRAPNKEEEGGTRRTRLPPFVRLLTTIQNDKKIENRRKNNDVRQENCRKPKQR